MAADDFENAMDDLVPETEGKPTYGPELYAICNEVRNELLKEWNGDDDDNDDLVELTPDGEAVIDGAFRPTELYRIAEAITEAKRRCSPATGHRAELPLDYSTVVAPLDALHRLRFTLGITSSSNGGPLLEQCERSVQYISGKLFRAQQFIDQQLEKIRLLEQKLSACVAVVEAQKRANAAGGEIANSELVDNLSAALLA